MWSIAFPVRSTAGSGPAPAHYSKSYRKRVDASLQRVRRPQRVPFRHSHGGTGCGSTHRPFFAPRASFSRLSSSVFPGATL